MTVSEPSEPSSPASVTGSLKPRAACCSASSCDIPADLTSLPFSSPSSERTAASTPSSASVSSRIRATTSSRSSEPASSGRSRGRRPNPPSSSRCRLSRRSTVAARSTATTPVAAAIHTPIVAIMPRPGRQGELSCRSFLCPKERSADRKSACAQRALGAQGEDEDARAPGSPAEARCLHARLHRHSEEAELGASEGGARPADERHGGHDLHSGRGAQPAGALGRSRPRRPREGSAGRPLQDHPRRARHRRRIGPEAGALALRRQEERVMPRRAEIAPRTVSPDPVYNSQLVQQLVNRVMNDGKKSVAESIVYTALDRIGTKTGRPPVEVLEQAVKTVTPVLEVKGRRVGGANYQVPVEVPQRRARTLAIRWIVTYARDRREKGMPEKLANEILDALNEQGGAYKRKDDLYRMAQANKAFAHYRW